MRSCLCIFLIFPQCDRAVGGAECDCLVISAIAARGTLLSKIENLFKVLGGQVTQGRGSRVRVSLNGVKAVFYEPHPQKETDKGAVKAVKEFLLNAGIEPEDNLIED